ncbi:hypothetical protein N9I58_01885 [Candidatus Thioglobus sp.]|jgi:hypothetical protein|nr:hypothetical protein [Candidatus Thioglobus sp.]
MTKNNLNILLLDNNRDRLNRTNSLIKCCDSSRYCVDPQLKVDQEAYESNNYDIVLAHYGNKEVEQSIADGDWDSGGAIIIFFSGGFDKDKEEFNDVWWVSASYIDKKENIYTLLNEVCKK